MEVCPYLEETFKILGRSWNGLILHYLSTCDGYKAHFSEMKDIYVQLLIEPCL